MVQADLFDHCGLGKQERKPRCAYLDEFEFCFNNRKNAFLFRDTMLKLIHSPNLESKNLVTA